MPTTTSALWQCRARTLLVLLGPLLAWGIAPGTEPRLWAEEPKPRATIRGHSGCVKSLAFAPDGKILASASNDNTIKLWDVLTGKELASLEGHTGGVNSLAFTPNGQTLVSGSSDKTVKLWDVAKRKAVRTLQGHTGAVVAVAISLDGQLVASGSKDQSVKIWDVQGGKERASLLDCLPSSDRSLAFSPDGATLASTDAGRMRLWDVKVWKERSTFLPEEPKSVWSLSFCPNGKTLAIAVNADEYTITLWETATGKQRGTLRGHTDVVLPTVFSPNGKVLASGSGDHSVTIWNVATGKKQAVLKHPALVHCLDFSPDGRSLASGSCDETIRFWDVSKITSGQGSEKTGASGKEVLSSRELDDLWSTLAGSDGIKAFQAINRLSEAPQQGIALLKERVHPASEPNAKEVARWIDDLESNQFAIRQKAREELTKIGELATPLLRKKQAGMPPLALHQDVQQLLTRIEGQLSMESLRAVRGVEVLEQCGSPDSMKVLENLAAGAEGARLTLEAKRSLARLNKQTQVGR